MSVGLIGVLQLIFAEGQLQVNPTTTTSYFVIYILFKHLVSFRFVGDRQSPLFAAFCVA